MATYITNSALDTKGGWEATKWVGRQVFDDALGMRPAAAYAWSSAALHIAGSLAMEHLLANAVGDSIGSVRKFDSTRADDQRIWKTPKGNHPFGRIPGGENTGGLGFDPSEMTTLTNQAGDALAVVGKGKVEAGLFSRLPGGPIHTGASAANFPGQSVKRLVPSSWYATCFGTCHQATNATLLASGISNTVADLHPHWTTFATTALYGNYGGGSARITVEQLTRRDHNE